MFVGGKGAWCARARTFTAFRERLDCLACFAANSQTEGKEIRSFVH